MSNQDITEVRRHLFDTLNRLTDKQAPMELDRARVVVDVAQTLINSAKVEVEFLRVTGADTSGFLGGGDLTPKPEKPVGVLGKTVHRLVG